MPRVEPKVAVEGDRSKPTPEQAQRLRIIGQPQRSHSTSVMLRVAEERTIEDIANEMSPRRNDDIRKRQKGRR